MINLTKDNKIYIGCPPQYVSGGPELLHQLCFILNEKGFTALMFYNCEGQFIGDPVHERFKHYNNPYVETIEDDKNNLFILPEKLIDTFNRFKNIRKCIWWLGINHYLLPTELFPHKYLRVLYHYLQNILSIKKTLTLGQIRKQNIINWAQCWYTVSFLERKGLKNVAYLSDYISDRYIQQYLDRNKKVNLDKRENIVIYNPKRNMEYTKRIMEMAPEIKFIAIENMNVSELETLMSRAKVYIDFGSHPGKDRLPREAVLFGCCILTSTIGSANFYDDVPINAEYKYVRKTENIKPIVMKIRDIFDNYEYEVINFDSYREYILNEKQRFIEDVDKLFCLREYEE